MKTETLDAIHNCTQALHNESLDLRELVEALYVIGMGELAKKLSNCSKTLQSLAFDIDRAVSEESWKEFQESQESTSRVITGVFNALCGPESDITRAVGIVAANEIGRN